MSIRRSEFTSYYETTENSKPVTVYTSEYSVIYTPVKPGTITVPHGWSYSFNNYDWYKFLWRFELCHNSKKNHVFWYPSIDYIYKIIDWKDVMFLLQNGTYNGFRIEYGWEERFKPTYKEAKHAQRKRRDRLKRKQTYPIKLLHYADTHLTHMPPELRQITLSYL